MPWLSVLIPAYNAAEFIQACVESILAQAADDPGIEVLVLDDGSTDGTRSRLERIAAACPGQVRLLLQPCNAGISAARNRLLAEATARHLWFVDADDLVLPGALAELRATIDRHDPDLVLCDFRYVRGNQLSRPRCTCKARRDIASGNRPQLVAAIMEAGELHVWSKIARREIWRQVEFPDGCHFEDIVGTCQLLPNVRSWIHVHRPWIGYRQHPASIMATLTATRLAEWMSALEGMQPLIADSRIADDRAAMRALTDFRLRNLASAYRRVPKLPRAGRDTALKALAAARCRLFPHGTASILLRWMLNGWWLRTLRTRRALSGGHRG